MSHGVLVNLKSVSVQIHKKRLFDKLSFSIHRGDLLALLGPNGCGKTTILNILRSRFAGSSTLLDDADINVQGEVFSAPGIDVAHLPQSLGTTSALTENDDLSPDAVGIIARLQVDFGLGELAPADSAMSDGERQKRALIQTLAAEHDLYLLDEPTNYLDMTGINVFENHMERLIHQNRGIILVTHDRTLVDNLATHTILITRSGTYSTKGGSARAWSLWVSDTRSRSKQVKDICKKIRQLQADMTSKANWAARKERQKIGAGGAKGHISRMSKKMAKRAKVAQQRAEREIERLEETKPFVPKRLILQFEEFEIRHRTVFSLERVSFAYPSRVSPRSRRRPRPLLRDITLAGTTRDKTCLMGANGSGKSTLMKLIQKHIAPTSGRSHLSKSVNTAYVPQGLSGFFRQQRLLDNFSDCDCSETTIRKHLGAALIRGDKAHEPVATFSYGELMRAAIVRCLLAHTEFLFLDEPTSHLDIESIEVLEQLLCHFSGGILVISHDRTFVENVADTLYLLEGGRLRLV